MSAALRRCALAGALALGLPSAVAGPARAADPVPAEITAAAAARIDEAARTATGRARGRTPAISVAVVSNGRVAYARAFGVADLGSNRAATPATRFRIASITKMLTAISVMQLVQGGRVRLDAPLAAYLPAAPHASEITIRQLLMHTSGVWNYGDEAIRSGRVTTPATPASIVAWVADRPLDQVPGAKFDYSNTGYVLLGLVVEAVSHQPLAAYEREHVLMPAGMRETTFGDAPADGPLAAGYMSATGTPAIPYSPSWFYADGDAVSTASDLARLDIALMAGKLVSPAAFAEMQSSAVDTPIAPGVRYGLGLMLAPYRGVTFVGHHGGVPGFEAENVMLPSANFAVVVLSDAFDFTTSVVSGAVLREAFPALTAAIPAPAAAPPASGEDPAVTATLRAFLAGVESGRLDPSTLSAEMAKAMTPDAVATLKAQLSPLGTVRALAYRSQEPVQTFRRFHYGATFSGGETLPVTLVIDTNGKIAGLFFA